MNLEITKRTTYMQKCERIISKSGLLKNLQLNETELIEYIENIKKESKLNIDELYDLIINGKFAILYTPLFANIWNVIHKYDYKNDYINKILLKNNSWINKNYISELNGTILLKFIGAYYNETNKVIYECHNIDILRKLNDKLRVLVDEVELKVKPRNNDDIKGLYITKLKLMNYHNITDDGINNLPLTNLILINNNTITNDGIKNLPLTSLSIIHNGRHVGSHITDDGIKNLHLEHLALCNNRHITDNAIKKLPLKEFKFGRDYSYNFITDDCIKLLRNRGCVVIENYYEK